MARKTGLNVFQTSRQAGRIPLVLVLGECAGPTRAFLNILLSHQTFDDSVVLSTKNPQAAALTHPHCIELTGVASSAQDSCLCCGLHGALGDALRTLFFGALNDRSKRLDRILIESDSIRPHQLAHTLKHTPFLGQRYVHQLTFRVVNRSQLCEAGVEALKGLDPIHNRAQQFLVFVDQGASSQSISIDAPLSCAERKAWSDLIEGTLPYQKVLFVRAKSTGEIESDDGRLSALARLSKDLAQSMEIK
jgi:hypothetical protein